MSMHRFSPFNTSTNKDAISQNLWPLSTFNRYIPRNQDAKHQNSTRMNLKFLAQNNHRVGNIVYIGWYFSITICYFGSELCISYLSIVCALSENSITEPMRKWRKGTARLHILNSALGLYHKGNVHTCIPTYVCFLVKVQFPSFKERSISPMRVPLFIERIMVQNEILRKCVSLHCVTKTKKLSLREGQPTQCGSWRHTKQPYVIGRFFVPHQDRGIFSSKVWNFHYFCIIFSFVVISMKNFEIYIINRYYRGETLEFLPEVSIHIFQQKTMSFAGKTWFQHFSIWETSD